MKRIIRSDNAPKAIGPYSQGVTSSELIFLSGQIALDKDTGEMSRAGVSEQTEIVLNNISALLGDAGSSLASVIKTTVYLADINDFSKVNEVYGRFFNESPPARSCVEVSALPKNALVEIEIIAERE